LRTHLSDAKPAARNKKTEKNFIPKLIHRPFCREIRIFYRKKREGVLHNPNISHKIPSLPKFNEINELNGITVFFQGFAVLGSRQNGGGRQNPP
jgi:hypothetical protein